MRVNFFAPIVCLALTIGGGQSVYTSLSNQKPVDVSIESLIATKPDAKWLQITGGVLDVLNASYCTTLGVGKADSIHIPLIPENDDSTKSKIHVLVETNDQKLIELVQKGQKLEKPDLSEEAALKFLLENREHLRVKRTVRGLVKYGFNSGDTEREIKGSYDNLAPDVILLKEGGKPDAMIGFLMLIAGLILGAVLLRSIMKSKSPPPLPRATGSTSPPLPV